MFTHLLKTVTFATRVREVKWSNMKISHSNIRNEPLWFKNIRLGTQGIERVIEYKYLGTTVTSKLKFLA